VFLAVVSAWSRFVALPVLKWFSGETGPVESVIGSGFVAVMKCVMAGEARRDSTADGSKIKKRRDFTNVDDRGGR